MPPCCGCLCRPFLSVPSLVSCFCSFSHVLPLGPVSSSQREPCLHWTGTAGDLAFFYTKLCGDHSRGVAPLTSHASHRPPVSSSWGGLKREGQPVDTHTQTRTHIASWDLCTGDTTWQAGSWATLTGVMTNGPLLLVSSPISSVS